MAERLAEIASDTAERASERTIRLATPAEPRGKTVAATAIVHNLLRAVEHPELLPFLSVVAERRLVGARLVERTDLHLPTFPYRHSLDLLTGEPAVWPESTDRINRFAPRPALSAGPAASRAWPATGLSLHVDIVD